MKMFIINLTYIKPVEEIDAHLTKHREFLDRYYGQGKFIASGRKNPRNGGIILCKADSISQVETIIKEDPFHSHGLARYEIIEFEPTKYADGFESFM